MNTLHKLIAATILSACALTAHAGEALKCKRNAMTDRETCNGTVAVKNEGFYSVAENHGVALMVGSMNDQHMTADALMVRIDGGAPFAMAADWQFSKPCESGMPCKWLNAASVYPTRAQWAAMVRGRVVLATPAEQDYTGTAVHIDPAQLRQWLADLAAKGHTPTE